MPFAENGGAVAVFLEHSWQGGLIVREVLHGFGVFQLLKWKFLSTREPIRQMEPGRVLARQNAGARGRTDGASSIRPRKTDALLRKRINVGSVIKSAALVSDVSATQVIYEKEKDIQFLFM